MARNQSEAARDAARRRSGTSGALRREAGPGRARATGTPSPTTGGPRARRRPAGQCQAPVCPSEPNREGPFMDTPAAKRALPASARHAAKPHTGGQAALEDSPPPISRWLSPRGAPMASSTSGGTARETHPGEDPPRRTTTRPMGAVAAEPSQADYPPEAPPCYRASQVPRWSSAQTRRTPGGDMCAQRGANT